MRSQLVPGLFRMKHLLCESLNSCRNKRISYCQMKQTKQFTCSHWNNSNNDGNRNKNENDIHNLHLTIDPKYKVFLDEDAEIIFDVDEEKRRIYLEEENVKKELENIYSGLNLNRGVTGVFDIEDLVAVLQRDNAKHIFVASVPAKYSYVDYIVVVSGKSLRHMQSLATFVRRIYKLKRQKGDIIPRVEGEKSHNWIAIDLGNIALHIFSEKARKNYDLETLWAVGPAYDDLSQNKTEVNMMEQYNSFLEQLEPEDSDVTKKK